MDIQKIRSAELASPHLTWVEHDLYDISNRIRDIEPGFFIMRNHRKRKFEVHSTGNRGGTYCFTVPYGELDARALSDCRERSLKNGGYKRLLDIDRHNRLLDEKRDRRFKGEVRDACLEAARDISLAVEKDETHSGYRRSHYMGGLK